MGVKLSAVRNDLKLERETGAPKTLACGVFVRVRRAGHPGWQKELDALRREYFAKNPEAEEVPEEELRAIRARVMARQGLTEWDLEGDDGKPVPMGEEAEKVLADESFHTLHSQVLTACYEEELFRAKEIAGAGKGSKRS